jgi:hypothetical protein
MATYNQKTIANLADDEPFNPQPYQVPDASLNGNASATVGGMQICQQKGDLVLAKGPDGGVHWYKFDAERSTVAYPILIYVGP